MMSNTPEILDDGKFLGYHEPNPQTILVVGDVREVLVNLHVADFRYDLIFADPPYNMGRDYDVWNDNMSESEYQQFTKDWLFLSQALLTPKGSMWVLVPDEIVSFVDAFCTMKLKLKRVNWCIWHYRFGQCNKSKFIRSKAHLLYYSKSDDRIWHPEKILVPSDRASTYNDPRTKESDTPGLRVPLDVWYGDFLGRVQGNNAERRKLHDNQVPERMVERILLACTEPDSHVLDPFSGSGTTSTVARALGLKSTTIEISKDYGESAWQRITEKGPVRLSAI